MQSLKTFIQRTLASVIGRSPVTLYERQRPLVVAGLLDAEEGIGPGSGVKASPRSVATLLIALLATDSPGDTETVAAFVKLKARGGQCELTGQTTFLDALAAILATKNPGEIWVQVERARSRALIIWGGKDQTEFTKGGKPPPPLPPGIHTYAALHQGFDAISKALKG